MQKKLIVGNWKMNPKTAREALAHFSSIKKGAVSYKNIETGVAAPFVYLPLLSKSAGGACTLGGQDVSSEKEGPFTGEISAPMLAAAKVKYCIVGHSERRARGETNELINKKVKQLLSSKIRPILCVGETERDQGMWYLSTVKTQIEECLAGVSKNALKEIVIAYEPVWAISTSLNRKDATPHDFEEMRIYVQKVLHDLFGISAKDMPRILYGGSVEEKNCGGFLSAGADGLLVGKSSLSPQKFTKILKIANEIR